MAIVACVLGGMIGFLGFLVAWLLMGLTFISAVQIYFALGLTTVATILVFGAVPKIRARKASYLAHTAHTNQS
ncbi:MAG: hypothetical protein AB8B58_18795 [Roseobacter sp.]